MQSSTALLEFRNSKTYLTHSFSQKSVAGWYSYLDTVEKADNCIVVLVLNKTDKPSTLDMNLVYNWASEKGIEVIKTSAIQGTGVDIIFETIAKGFAEWQKAEEEKEAVHSVVEINDDNQEARKLKKRCC